MAIALTIIHGFVLFGLFVAVAVAWFRESSDIKDCSRFAAFVVGVVGLASLPLVFLPGALASLFAFAFVFGLARTFLYTAVGISCCVGAGFAAFPVLNPGLGGLNERAARLPIGSTMVVALVVAAGWCMHTVLLFRVFTPELSDAAERLFAQPSEAGGSENVAIGLIAVSVIALEEELIYRLGIQNYLARLFGWWDRRYWLAILASATIWTIAHVGMLEPGWVKLLQIFPAGIALGWLARRYGIEACIVVHVVFNLAVFWMEAVGLILTT